MNKIICRGGGEGKDRTDPLKIRKPLNQAQENTIARLRELHGDAQNFKVVPAAGGHHVYIQDERRPNTSQHYFVSFTGESWRSHQDRGNALRLTPDKKKSFIRVVSKGDEPGHPFHGNQYMDGEGGGRTFDAPKETP